MWKPQKPSNPKFKTDLYKSLSEASEFIFQIGEFPQLREQSKTVNLSEIQTDEFRKKLQYLKRCLKRYRKITGYGRGITAVQVGIPESFSLIYMPEIDGKLLALVNPRITRKSPNNLKYPEICMSASPIIAVVIRPEWVEVEYYDESGEKQLWKSRDRMYNRILQHEIDHTQGKISIDQVESKDLVFELNPDFYKSASFKEV